MLKPALSEVAHKILEARYLRKDREGVLCETPEEMFRRVARHIASAEKIFDPSVNPEAIAEDFYQMMALLEFLPNSPTLMNAGKPLGQLAACFVLPVEDSLESIFDAVKYAALIHQSGGGTGFSFSRLRPKNDIVMTTGGIASGPVSFMQVFNTTTNVIRQGGARRGANMASLQIDHPDIVEFITVKRNLEELRNFNLSVAITGRFMRACEENGSFTLVNPRNGKKERTLGAAALFDLIAECAWETGEPGVLFLDHINVANPLPLLGLIETTNPCGEQPLLPYEACNLGSVNLVRMLRKGVNGIEVDWNRLERTVRLAVRFLDNVIEVNHYPLPQIESITKQNRKIGLGVMGFAHFLMLLGIPYFSAEGLETAKGVMRFIQEIAHEASRLLAVKRGPFPNFLRSVYASGGSLPLRNATVTTIAPTGTLSLIAGCSSGIEPLYSLFYERRILDDFAYAEIDPVFKAIITEKGFWTAAFEKGLKTSGRVSDLKTLPASLKLLFATAAEIPSLHHVEMQAAFQEYTDNAVSKTINIAPQAAVEDVKEAFLLASRLKCKGVTVYRSGTRADQVLRCGSGPVC